MDSDAHPSEQQLKAFNEGLLDEVQLRGVSLHLDVCLDCCERLHRLSQGDHVLPWLRQLTKETGPGLTKSQPDPSPMPERIGEYLLLGEVGRGGMGVVYRAQHTKLQRPVALKTILAAEYASTEQRVRFRREAELAAQVRHPNVVQVYEVGSLGGRPFLALEWVDGGTLAQRLGGRTMTPREAAHLTETLARAIQAAHEQGVLHRDLKPSNILLTKEGTPKVTDFGLARPLAKEADLTRSGTILGTPEYMAPEMAAGRGHEAGPAADVYSLGAILHELLCGVPPFRGATPLETMRLSAETEPVSLRTRNSSIPNDLDTICLKCLHKAPGDRYPGMVALAEDLRRFLDGESILARRSSPAERLARWSRRNPWLGILLLACAFLLLFAVCGTSWGWWMAEGRRREAEAQRRLVEARSLEVLQQQDATAQELARAQENLFTAHLNQIDTLHATEPQAALALLHSEEFCPPKLRDRAWCYYVRACEHSYPFKIFHTDSGVPETSRWQRTNAVAYHPEGRFFATAGQDRIVRIWEERTLQVVSTWEGHEGPIWGLCFSRDGSRVATASEDGSARVWEFDSGRLLHIFPHKTRVNAVCFSPDGNTLATGDHEFAVRLWDLSPASQTPRIVFPTQYAWITSLRFNPTGTLLASASGNGLVCIWDLNNLPIKTAPKPRALLRHPKQVSTIDFSPDGKLLATGSHDAPVKLWDVATGTLHAAFQETEYRPKVVVFSPDGNILATGAADAKVRLWNVPTRQLRLTLQGHTGDITGLAYHPHRFRLISSEKNGNLLQWDINPDSSLKTLEGPWRGGRDTLRYSPDGKSLAIVMIDNSVTLLDIHSPKESRTLLRHSQGENEATRIAGFLPDNSELVTYTSRGIHFWDLQKYQVRSFSAPSSEPISWVALSSDGKYLAITPKEGEDAEPRTYLREVKTGQITQTFTPAPRGHFPLFHPNNSTLALVGREGTELHGLSTPYFQRVDFRPGKAFAVWNPDGMTLTLRGHQGLTFLHLATGQQRTLRDDAGHVPLAVCWDGTIAMGRHRDIQLWHPPSGQLRGTIRGHASPVTALAFEATGTRLASISQEGILKIWDLSKDPQKESR